MAVQPAARDRPPRAACSGGPRSDCPADRLVGMGLVFAAGRGASGDELWRDVLYVPAGDVGRGSATRLLPQLSLAHRHRRKDIYAAMDYPRLRQGLSDAAGHAGTGANHSLLPDPDATRSGAHPGREHSAVPAGRDARRPALVAVATHLSRPTDSRHAEPAARRGNLMAAATGPIVYDTDAMSDPVPVTVADSVRP